MRDTSEWVLSELGEYQQMKKKIALLQYECDHAPHVTDYEVLEGLSLSHPVGSGEHQPGHVSDRTMQIAMQFRDTAKHMNREVVNEILDELFLLEDRVNKLEFYVSQLDPKQAEVIRMHYFEGKSWRQMQAESHASSHTLMDRRNEAVKALAQMYQYMEAVKKEKRPYHA